MDELGKVGIEGRNLALSDAGVELEGEFHKGYICNLWTRTGGRVLVRLPSFRAGVLEEFFARVSYMRWELWLNPTIPLEIQAHVDRSRIQHEGRVATASADAIRRRFRTLGDSGPPDWVSHAGPDSEGDDDTGASKQRILVHVINNHCTFSLDTTGAHLHRRGYRPAHSGAPLRETLAAGMLIKAGWKGDVPLVDGMCGAGTLPIEAAMMARGIPPGAHRSFLFQHWPAFQERKWSYLRRQALQGVLAASPARIIGLDRNPQVMDLARDNGHRARVERDVEWCTEDFMRFDPSSLGLTPGLLVLNPPYGKRLEGGGREFYGKIGARLKQVYQGWQVAILAPERGAASALGLSSMRLWNISHGGLEILMVQGRI
jgi:23S rRNA G2445 N2-methylase RlmL